MGAERERPSMPVEVDDRGRPQLPEDIRDRYGERFQLVELPGAIKLVPVAPDPVEGLREAMPGIQDVPISELREQAEEMAREEACHPDLAPDADVAR